MVRETLKWCDNQQVIAIEEYEENKVKGLARAFMSGFVEGAMDGFVIGGIALGAVGLVAAIVNIKK